MMSGRPSRRTDLQCTSRLGPNARGEIMGFVEHRADDATR
jgi:hypothetical protein